MTEPQTTPAPAPAPQAPGVSLSPDQVRQAIAAGLEVLSGAAPDKVLQLVDQLPACKLVMRGIASGELVVARLPLTTPAPANRAERRAEAATRRKSGPDK
jgi:hypothetical protein